MHHGTYMWKYHRKSRYYSWYRYQKYYLILIWVNTMASLAFLIDFFFFKRGSYHRVVKMMKMSNTRKQMHYLVRGVTFITIYIWPFLLPQFSWTKAIVWSVVPYWIIGFCFAINSQLNHVTDENQDKFSRDWYKHQVLTSHTYSPDSLFWFFFSGGLNLQIEHHLFPGVNHWHLRKIHPIVYEVCKKHNVHYNLSTTFLTAMKKHMDHIENMSTYH
jgi:fatty acid desaturase